MTKEEAIRFKESWAAVNRLVIEEARRATLEDRLRGLNTLYLAARSFGWGERLRAEDVTVRDRWQRLREKLSEVRSDGQRESTT